jgi:hypothetical protein
VVSLEHCPQTRFLRMEELRELARDERERLALYI